MLAGITDNFTYDGKVYGIPYQMQVAPLFCNTELFDKYKVKIPENYEELLTAVKTFKENKVTPLICGAKDLWPAMFYYDVLALRTAGSKLSNEALAGKASFNTPEFIDAANKLAELTKAGAFGSNAMSVSWDNANVDFAQGKGAMLFNGNWVAGNVSAETSAVKGKIVAKKFPIVTGGKGSATEYLGGAGDGYMINSETKNPELAAKVLLFIAEKLAHDMYEANTGLPGWKVQVDESKISPLSKQISDMTKDSTGFTLWWDVFMEASDADTHKNLVVELIGGQITPENFAKEMQKLNEN
jgi:raffinose/stachyose/melibiose transport system substrate-binding protein